MLAGDIAHNPANFYVNVHNDEEPAGAIEANSVDKQLMSVGITSQRSIPTDSKSEIGALWTPSRSWSMGTRSAATCSRASGRIASTA